MVSAKLTEELFFSFLGGAGIDSTKEELLVGDITITSPGAADLLGVTGGFSTTFTTGAAEEGASVFFVPSPGTSILLLFASPAPEAGFSKRVGGLLFFILSLKGTCDSGEELVEAGNGSTSLIIGRAVKEDV